MLSAEQAAYFAPLRGVDIFKRQAWMIHKDCLGQHTGAEFAQNQLYRNARTSNDRFAIHDVRVHFDAFVGHGALFVRFRSKISDETRSVGDRPTPAPLFRSKSGWEKQRARRQRDYSSNAASTNPAGSAQNSRMTL